LLVPALQLTLLEPRAKRTAFLRTSLGTLARPDIALLSSRSTQVAPAFADIALSRATLPPPLWLREGARLARSGVWVLLAQDEAPVLPAWKIELELRYVWPLTGAPRRALRYAHD
jgi:16S rRNA (guanine527-N7)-methyltransferase